MLHPAALWLALICATAATTITTATAAEQRGIASWYSDHRTASGRPFRSGAMTAAHRSLRFGTRVLVTNTRNGRSATVTITDRGPFVRGRVIDLTQAGARALHLDGLAPVVLRW